MKRYSPIKKYNLIIEMEIRPTMAEKGVISSKLYLYKPKQLSSGILPVFSSKNLVSSGISQMQMWYFGPG